MIKTLSDINPNTIYFNKEQSFVFLKSTKNIKDTKTDFEISDSKIAEELCMLNAICKVLKKPSYKNLPEADKENYYFLQGDWNGKYRLTPEGLLYKDRAFSAKHKSFWMEFRAWITLFIALIGLIIACISLLSDFGIVTFVVQ